MNEPLIELQQNVNRAERYALAAEIKPFNRTTVECKFNFAFGTIENKNTFNRTTVECK